MAPDDTIARLKALSERLDRLRRQAREMHDAAADEVRAAYSNSRQREMPNSTECAGRPGLG
jgi:hypothetical protein